MGMLADRVRKRFQHLRKWARREGVSCFRVYDGDIPEHPLAVDFYESRAAVYARLRKADKDARERRRWLDLVQLEVAEALDLPAGQVYLRDRRRLTGSDQYGRRGERGEEFPVREGGYVFLVNLTDYHDTGLFLDHRRTRRMIQEEARGRRVLNLFCYTGSFSVYAAGGGALSTLNVDLSTNYLQWARRNFERNRMPSERHRTTQADVMEWLERACRERQEFDLIVCDPPTFSNSKRTDNVFDVQRDQGDLIRRCLSLLTPAGVLYFSCNRRGFKLDQEILGRFAADEITRLTIPEDYLGHQPHRCFRFPPGMGTAVVS